MATTNFFGQIAQLNLNGNLQIIIGKGVADQMIVSVMLQDVQCADNACRHLTPLIIKGSARELCEQFFDRITIPLETVSGVLDNMDSFMKQVEEMKQQSAMEKAKANKEKKEAEEKEKKFKQQMKRADELMEQKLFRDAWTVLSKLKDFPEKKEEIRAKQEQCERNFAPDIFSITEKQPEAEATNNVEP